MPRTPTRQWRPAPSARASSEVAAQIKQAFFEGMKSGDWLGTESELAVQFGVSRITFRDAVRTLEAEGIVDVRVGAGGGLRIAKADPHRYADSLSVQLHLAGITWQEVTQAMKTIEPTTASLAAEHATDEDVELLRDAVLLSRRLVDDPKAFTASALNFHLIVSEACGNRALEASVRALRSVQTQKFEPNTSPVVAERVCEAHDDILDAIASRDAIAAASAMDSHLDKLLQRGSAGALM